MNSKANKSVLTNISHNEANKRLRSSASPPTTPTQKCEPSFTLSTAQQEAHLAAIDPRKPHPKETPRHLEYDPMSPWEKRGGMISFQQRREEDTPLRQDKQQLQAAEQVVAYLYHRGLKIGEAKKLSQESVTLLAYKIYRNMHDGVQSLEGEEGIPLHGVLEGEDDHVGPGVLRMWEFNMLVVTSDFDEDDSADGAHPQFVFVSPQGSCDMLQDFYSTQELWWLRDDEHDVRCLASVADVQWARWQIRYDSRCAIFALQGEHGGKVGGDEYTSLPEGYYRYHVV
jgi:hypothetical protein